MNHLVKPVEVLGVPLYLYNLADREDVIVLLQC